ncbi:mRNA-decapping enzyme 1B-like isoform X2 [Littorina saxatilis]|uniref:mRNA-decapping enzyme C-terminal domain-containing protein n=1 Tax=Littorina saxatilis TaxID=31220 RepID=A0AAN9BAT5_9CAEN
MADHPINLTTLQQQDPYITEILGMATQVHLYNYNQKIKNEWDKSDIGGSLFVYKRSACPIHGMMILNKQGMENWVEPISEQLDFQLSTPFLLYRCNKRIQGIWFYKPKECEDVGELMDNLREEAAAKISGTSGADSAQGKTLSLGQKNVDIMQLLSGAQQRYESKTKGGSELMQSISVLSSVSAGVPPLIKPTPVKLPGDTSGSGGDGPSQLQALFQNVKLTQQLQQRPGGMVDQFTGDPPPDVTINPLHRSLSVTEVESGASPRNLATAGSLTVEEIERQQREQIKRSDSRGQGQLQEGGMSQSPAARELLSILTAAAGDGQGSSLPAMPQMPLTTTGDARVKQEPPELVTARSTELLTPGDFAPAVKRLDSTTGGLGGPCPDVLMTPLAFAAPQQPPLLTASPSTPISSAALLEQLGNLQRGSQGSPGLASPPPPDISPLTRQQLQQAMIHIIRTDEDFVSRLHEAYLASFREQLGSFPSAKR